MVSSHQLTDDGSFFYITAPPASKTINCFWRDFTNWLEKPTFMEMIPFIIPSILNPLQKRQLGRLIMSSHLTDPVIH